MMKKPIEAYISYNLAAAHRLVHQSLSARLKGHGVQVEAWRVLEALDSETQLSMGQLAKIVLMNPPSLSKLVDRMVMDGLVHRKIAAADQRQVNLMLTDLGRKRMTRVRAHVQNLDEKLSQQIGAEDVERLTHILRLLQ